MFCTNCGETLEKGMVYCPGCGTRIDYSLYPDDAPSEEPEKVKECVPPAKGNRLITVLLCLVLLLSLTAAEMSMLVRMTYSDGKVKTILAGFDVRESTIPDFSSGREVHVVDFLEEASGFDFERTAGISKKNLEKLLNRSFVIGTVSDILADYADYFLKGEKPAAITRNDVVDFVKEHDDTIFELTGFRFTYPDPEKNKTLVYTVDIDNAFKDLGTEEITVEWIEQQLHFPMRMVAGVLSVFTLAGLILLGLILIVLIAAVNRKRPGSGWKATGLTLIIAGTVPLLMTAVLVLFLRAREKSILRLFLEPAGKNALVMGCAILAAGVILLLIGSFRKKIKPAVY